MKLNKTLSIFLLLALFCGCAQGGREDRALSIIFEDIDRRGLVFETQTRGRTLFLFAKLSPSVGDQSKLFKQNDEEFVNKQIETSETLLSYVSMILQDYTPPNWFSDVKDAQIVSFAQRYEKGRVMKYVKGLDGTVWVFAFGDNWGTGGLK